MTRRNGQLIGGLSSAWTIGAGTWFMVRHDWGADFIRLVIQIVIEVKNYRENKLWDTIQKMKDVMRG